MIRRLGVVAIAALYATITAPTASAQFTGACGGTDFFTCLNLAVGGQGTNKLGFTVTNVSDGLQANNPNSTLFEFGVGNSAFTGSMPTVSVSSSDADRFDIFSNTSAHPNPYNGAGLSSGVLFGLDAQAPAPANGLHVGESATFFLTFVDASDATAFLTNMQLAAHDGGGLTEACGSNKVVFSIAGTATDDSSTPSDAVACSGPPSSTVPEPSSMALLGTGLVGLIPMARRRRK